MEVDSSQTTLWARLDNFVDEAKQPSANRAPLSHRGPPRFCVRVLLRLNQRVSTMQWELAKQLPTCMRNCAHAALHSVIPVHWRRNERGEVTAASSGAHEDGALYVLDGSSMDTYIPVFEAAQSTSAGKGGSHSGDGMYDGALYMWAVLHDTHPSGEIIARDPRTGVPVVIVPARAAPYGFDIHHISAAVLRLAFEAIARAMPWVSHPIVAYHGTSGAYLESILRNGLQARGITTPHERQGDYGMLGGVGVYMSHWWKAARYARCDVLYLPRADGVVVRALIFTNHVKVLSEANVDSLPPCACGAQKCVAQREKQPRRARVCDHNARWTAQYDAIHVLGIQEIDGSSVVLRNEEICALPRTVTVVSACVHYLPAFKGVCTDPCDRSATVQHMLWSR